MARIIRNGRVVTDNWSPVDAAEGALPAALPCNLPDGDLLLPLAVWLGHRDALIALRKKTGVRLGLRVESHDDPETFAADLGEFALIAVHFAQFTDGRGYSLARLLRERHGYRRELRAVGDVLRDNLFYLSRCGFDAFALANAANLDTDLASLRDFSDGYQASVERPQPLFRRRESGSVSPSVALDASKDAANT